ncbi:hypothetical protein FGO68_gene14414 [Halteria grandinella]|uniref:Uncharacterized protein n=1 Tax=Halteria grandinella TaxID=5974 RepID=A0A8J8T6Y0_HALGN|nr:hypothetical protein FGO68_gene14414 [Halteria grandinella]
MFFRDQRGQMMGSNEDALVAAASSLGAARFEQMANQNMAAAHNSDSLIANQLIQQNSNGFNALSLQGYQRLLMNNSLLQQGLLSGLVRQEAASLAALNNSSHLLMKTPKNPEPPQFHEPTISAKKIPQQSGIFSNYSHKPTPSPLNHRIVRPLLNPEQADFSQTGATPTPKQERDQQEEEKLVATSSACTIKEDQIKGPLLHHKHSGLSRQLSAALEQASCHSLGSVLSPSVCIRQPSGPLPKDPPVVIPNNNNHCSIGLFSDVNHGSAFSARNGGAGPSYFKHHKLSRTRVLIHDGIKTALPCALERAMSSDNLASAAAAAVALIPSSANPKEPPTPQPISRPKSFDESQQDNNNEEAMVKLEGENINAADNARKANTGFVRKSQFYSVKKEAE